MQLVENLRGHNIVLLGGVSDQRLCAELAAGLTHVQGLAGRLTLSESFGCFAGAQLIVCNSSTAMHVGAAFRKPCIVLLGDGIPDAKQHASMGLS
jgi:heptosyltransferase-2